MPRCVPCRRTITAMSRHATPSSTWRRRSSRATAACSSEVCGDTHASIATGVGARCGVVSSIVAAPGNASVANRAAGTSVAPWNENTCAPGSAATTISGARSPRSTASNANVVSW